MPLYEFRCTECGNEFEVILRFSEADRAPTCPQCQGHTQKKLSTVASFNQASQGGSTTQGSQCGGSGRFT